MKNESLLGSMPKLIMTVTIVVLVGALFGMLGYYFGSKNVTNNMPVDVKYQKDQSDKINEKETENNKQEDTDFLEKIADWKTYENKEYGFEIKYPENIESYPKDWGVDFAEKSIAQNKFFTIYLYDGAGYLPNNEIGFSFEKWVDEQIKNKIFEDKKIFDNGALAGIEVLDQGIVPFRNILVEKNNKIYSFSIIENSSSMKLFDQIISTFKFTNTDEIGNWKTYQNEEYGFEIILFESWKGYKVYKESWNGTTLDGNSVKYEGPKIIIRNPKWSEYKIWQDIPILVFTKDEWQLIEANNLGIFAAPIAPSKLGVNNKYVFALPPRWIGFADALGQDEAQKIVATFKVLALDKANNLKTYNGSKTKIGSDFSFKYSSEIWNSGEINLTHKNLGGCTLSPSVLWRNRLVNIISSENINLGGYEARKVKIGIENNASSIDYYFDSETSAVFSLSIPENKKGKTACEKDVEAILNTISF